MDINISIEELKARKRELGHTNKSLAEMSGVPLSTIQKVMGGATRNPRRETLLDLAMVLFPGSFALKDEEQPFTGRRQGFYTVKDYRRLPDDTRMELIDGRLYYLAAPTTVHQLIISKLSARLDAYSEEHDGKCLVLTSPVDVQLDCDEKTMLQPDIIVVCDENKVQKKNIYGAPDLVIEVLSPTTRGIDQVLKFNKYWIAGVREYWIIDPEEERICVYNFAKMTPPHFYSFEDTVPVNISGGDLIIDFGKIAEAVRRYIG